MTDIELKREIERLQRACDTKDKIIHLLRCQLRGLGHMPMVVEDEATGKAEAKFRSAAWKAGAQ